MKKEGFVTDVSEGQDTLGHKTLLVGLKYVDGQASINGIERVSRPGRRLYFGSQEIPHVLNGLGMSIITTPRGLLKDRDARRQKVGGEIVCKVW